MRAGMLRDIVVLKDPGEAVTGELGSVSYPNEKTYKRWALVRGLTTNERLTADRIVGVQQLRFLFRYDQVVSSVKPDWTMEWEGSTYDCDYPTDPSGRRRELVIIGKRSERGQDSD